MFEKSLNLPTEEDNRECLFVANEKTKEKKDVLTEKEIKRGLK